MMQTSGIIICLSYILGLLFTAIPWGGVWILLLGVVGAVFFRRWGEDFQAFSTGLGVSVVNRFCL